VFNFFENPKPPSSLKSTSFLVLSMLDFTFNPIILCNLDPVCNRIILVSENF